MLARGLARVGFDVVAVGPSATATAMAREASEREGLSIVHKTAPAEQLGLEDEAYGVAYYADTFEITSHLDRVISQAAQVLRPGGVLIYDTVNRTVLSRLMHWHVALRAEAAVLAGHPAATRHLAAARPIVAGNPIASAILDRAAALRDDDHERVLATATTFETAGCPYQRARTLILAGRDTATTGKAALVNLGLSPATTTG